MTPNARETTAKNPWWTATIAGMASYLDAAAIVSTGMGMVLFEKEFDLGPAALGQLSALLTVMIAIGALVGGRLGDKYGRRKVFSTTMGIFAAGALALVFATAPWMLFLGIILLGFAAGADLPVSMAMIAETAPPGKKGKMITFSHILWMVGVLAVQLIGIIVGEMGTTGGRILFGHLLVMSLIVLVLRAGLPESPEWATSRTRAENSDTIAMSSLKTLFHSSYVVPLIATGLFYAIANVAANTNGQFSTYLYVNVAGASVTTASTIGLIAFGCSFLGLLATMKFADTRWRMPVFIAATAVSTIAFLVPAIMGTTTPTLAIMAVLYSLGGAVAGEPMYKVWSQELFPTIYRSTAQGITIGFTRVVAAAIALFTPAIINGGVQVLFIFLVTTTLASCLIGVLWLAKLSKAEPSTSDHEQESTPATDARESMTMA
ncbi:MULTISPECIES: MFS transporter [Arthrobacter]|uniref:MFS transporter n=1 Tax=Arthrobacter terricola TaxID=2547396 RepID=A0A4R5KC47_9MICC|nr:MULTISPECIES: MFS transporter [Arthrobacter]MBT8161755.1 MFS transporter [Arthrobacter sp. GN70]TDF92676.1 MFS transporter [Arthrobacter terricola]